MTPAVATFTVSPGVAPEGSALPAAMKQGPSRSPSRPSSPGSQVTLDQFEILDGDAGRSLGKGSFGVVRRIRRKGTGDVYALKNMQKIEVIEGNLIDQVEREIQVQRTLKHENVVRLYKYFEDAETVYLLLEYCAKGELYQLLRTQKGRRFPENVARHYFVQAVHGLKYLHSQCIVHRDLKPENLLVNHNDVLKIADFGWCAVSTVTRCTFCGTLDYLAPEMIQGRGHNHTLDIWSLGVLLYEMVVGRPPFQSTNHMTLISKILSTELRFPAFVQPEISDLVHRLLQREPADRLPLELVLRNAWVLGTSSQTVDGANVHEDGQISSALPVAVEAAPPNGTWWQGLQTSASTRVGEAPAATAPGATVPAAVAAPLPSPKWQQALSQQQPQAPPQQQRAAALSATNPAPLSSPVLQPRTVAAPPGFRVMAPQQLQASRQPSPPQTPIQQLPFRGIAVPGVGTARMAGVSPGGLRVAAPGTGSVGATGAEAMRLGGRQIARPPSSSAQNRSVSSSDGAAVGIASADAFQSEEAIAARMPRRESPPAHSPSRRPRSTGPPQAAMPMPQGAGLVDLSTSTSASAQGVPSSMSLTAPPKTPLQGPRTILPGRSSAVVPGGYPVQPCSPSPCSAFRSISPDAAAGGLQMAYAQHQHGAVTRVMPGMLVRRPG